MRKIKKYSDERTIFLFGDVTKEKICEVITSLWKMNAKSHEPITLIINTDGGDSSDMFALCDVLKTCNSIIRTIGIGDVLSAGILLLAAGTKGYRFIGPSTTIMTHKIQISFEDVSIEHIKNQLRMWERVERLWVSSMIEFTGQSRSVIETLNSSNGDVYLTPKQCCELGIADHLLYDGLINAEEPYT